jgi:hypothetical protein
MANGEPRVLASAPPGGGRRISTAAVIGGLVLLLVGFALGALIAGSGEEEATPLPSIDDSGVPSGFAHSEEGAAEAASSYMDLFNLELALDPDRAQAVLERIATPAFAGQMLDALAAARDPILQAAGRPGGLAAAGGVAATEVERYTDDAATVRVVSVATAAGRGRDAAGRLSVDERRVGLRWEDGDWRAAGFDGQPRDVVELETTPAVSNAIRAALEDTDVAP